MKYSLNTYLLNNYCSFNKKIRFSKPILNLALTRSLQIWEILHNNITSNNHYGANYRFHYQCTTISLGDALQNLGNRRGGNTSCRGGKIMSSKCPHLLKKLILHTDCWNCAPHTHTDPNSKLTFCPYNINCPELTTKCTIEKTCQKKTWSLNDSFVS